MKRAAAPLPRPQIQAERLRTLQRLALEQSPLATAADTSAAAASATPTASAAAPALVPWYVMTSAATRRRTEAFFREHSHFGLEPGQVVFFDQGWLPCLSPEARARAQPLASAIPPAQSALLAPTDALL